MNVILLSCLLSGLSMVPTSAQAMESAGQAKGPVTREVKGCLKENIRKSVRTDDGADQTSQAFTPEDIITEVPEGEAQNYVRSGDAYTNSMFGAGQVTVDNMLGRMVRCADGTVYLWEPLSQIATQSWLKGTEKEGVITFELPQAIYSDGMDGVTYTYTVQMAHYQALSETDETVGGVYVPNGEGETRNLVFREVDGVWVMDSETMKDHPVVLGMFDDEDKWVIFSDWNMKYTKFDGKSLTPPEGLETQTWEFVYGQQGMNVKLGFMDNDVYMSGIAGPTTWIKGELKDNVISFPSRQLVGINNNDRLIYFYGADEEVIYNEEYDFSYTVYTEVEAAKLNYDAENKVIKGDNAMVLAVGNNGIDYYETAFSKPVISLVTGEVSKVPANPVPDLFSAYEPTAGYGTAYFIFPMLNVDGHLLNVENLYYRLIVDGEAYEFMPEDYEGLEAATTEIPFTFTNMNTISYYSDVNHFFNFYFDGAESMGVQTLYKDEDGKAYESEIKYFFDYTKADEIHAGEGNIAGIEYYDLFGRRISAPEKGISIKCTRYADGQMKAEKIIRK